MGRVFFGTLLALLAFAPSVSAQVDTTPTPFMNTQMCVQNTAGFDDQLRPLPNPPTGFRNKVFSAVFGYSHLNDDGVSATSNWRSTATGLDNNFTYAGNGTCTGPISRQDDGSLLWTYECQGTTTVGDTAGTMLTYHGGASIHLVADGTGIAVSHDTSPPTVERVDAIPPLPAAPYTYYRICSRSGTTGALPLP